MVQRSMQPRDSMPAVLGSIFGTAGRISVNPMHRLKQDHQIVLIGTIQRLQIYPLVGPVPARDGAVGHGKAGALGSVDSPHDCLSTPCDRHQFLGHAGRKTCNIAPSVSDACAA